MWCAHHKMYKWGRAVMDSLCRVRPSVRPSIFIIVSALKILYQSSNLAEMFTATRECAEPMLSMCQLKVKVKIKGQISNNQILDIMSCLLCKSYTNWKIDKVMPLFKSSNLHIKYQILDNMSCPLYKSYTNGIIFFKLYSNVQISKVMCRTHVTFVPA